MLKIIAVVAIAFAAAFILSCGSALDNPMPYNTACSNLQTPVEAKCGSGSFSCAIFLAGCSTTKNVETADITNCVTQITAAADCTAVSQVVCTIHCEK